MTTLKRNMVKEIYNYDLAIFDDMFHIGIGICMTNTSVLHPDLVLHTYHIDFIIGYQNGGSKHYRHAYSTKPLSVIQTAS